MSGPVIINQDGRHVFALSEITESIERMFRKHYALPYWIRAEMSKLNFYPQSGHCYPDLVERKDRKIKAQIRGVIWKDDLFKITQKFEEVTKEEFREGINIMFLAHVKYSSEYGLSLQIIDIEPLYTLGELVREKMESIAKLKQEGIFNNNRLIPMPLLPKRLAVISAQTSKGYNDLIVTLSDNPYGYRFMVTLFHAVLQGDGAIETIRKQLSVIDKDREQFDAVLIIRGGGDEIGMASYDNYLLARDVAVFPLPVITGIGHSTNETVVEMVASANKITPTEVAYYLINQFKNFSDRIESAAKMMELASKLIIDTDAARSLRITNLFVDTVNAVIQLEYSFLEEQALAVRDATSVAAFNHRIALSRYESSLQIGPLQIPAKMRSALLTHEKMLSMTTRHLLNYHQKEIGIVDARVKLLDPVGVLKRGFTITRVNGKSIAPNTLPSAGDILETETWKGKINSVVKETKPK